MPEIVSLFHRQASEVVLTAQISASSVDAPIFVANRNYKVVSIEEIHSVVGGTSAALRVRKASGTTAPSAGTALHSANFDLTATVNTKQAGAIVAADALVKAGEKISLDFSGTLTGLAGSVTIVLRPA